MGDMSSWRLRIFCLFFLFCVVADAGRTEAEALRQVDEPKLLGLAQNWADAVGQNNPEALNSILDEKYEHIHGTGLQESRNQFLEALRSGTRKYAPIQLEDVRVRSFNTFALVSGKFALKAEVRGKVVEGVNRFCMTLIERTSGWKILQFQGTAMPAKP
jgi:Domain of unknown function (DUF4440)